MQYTCTIHSHACIFICTSCKNTDALWISPHVLYADLAISIIILYIYIILITWVRVWYGRDFVSRLIYFQVKIKPENEMTSVISGLFHTRYLHYHS